MKITPTIFSFPPYISARWTEVRSLKRASEDSIEVLLISGSHIVVPGLSQELIDQIFSCHAEAMEMVQNQPFDDQGYLKHEDLNQLLSIVQNGIKEVMALILKLGSTAISSVGKALEHDPKNSNLPILSDEMKNKVLMLLNIVPREDILEMAPPEPGCTCMYCQLTRILREAIVGDEKTPSPQEEEPVNEKDLEFSQWSVTPISDKLFLVRNKLDQHEEYRVFLGNPIGCTCGKASCEHIIAVLRS